MHFPQKSQISFPHPLDRTLRPSSFPHPLEHCGSEIQPPRPSSSLTVTVIVTALPYRHRHRHRDHQSRLTSEISSAVISFNIGFAPSKPTSGSPPRSPPPSSPSTSGSHHQIQEEAGEAYRLESRKELILKTENCW